jgi:diguanylate cyclase (GGDEF)-like protein/PAS domain S-box-containing protein
MYEKILERSVDELRLLGWESITHPDDLLKDAEQFTSYKTGSDTAYHTYKRYVRPDGSLVWGSLTLAPLLFENGSKQMNIAMLEDITERIHAEEKLRENEKLKEVILSNLPGMVYRCNYDREWTMQFVSDGCYELTGYQPESLLYNNEVSFNDLINREYRDYLWNKWSELLEVKGNLKEEYSITTASGEIKWVLEQGHGVYDDNGKVAALEGLIIDITDRKKKEDEIRYLNYHDVLTGLYNRRFFDKKIEVLDSENQLPVSVIIGDINGLKLINDALGHIHGNKFIIAISNILRDSVSGRGIVARTGGGDFGIILPGTNMDEVNKLMRKIEKSCNEYISKSKNAMYHTSISLGCATKANEIESLGSIIKNAEDNMYSNKLLQNKSMHSSVISSMKTALLEKSQDTEEHALRLIELSKAIGVKMKLTDEQLNELEILSTLHDIGKIGVSDSIINKPGKLTVEERILMNKHPEIGYRIAMATKELIPIAEYILCHHERYDGKGYPQGIKGKEIPLLSRIVAVVDAYDAMTEDRPYRKAMHKEDAVQEIRQNAGSQFDPEITKIFLDILSEGISEVK